MYLNTYIAYIHIYRYTQIHWYTYIYIYTQMFIHIHIFSWVSSHLNSTHRTYHTKSLQSWLLRNYTSSLGVNWARQCEHARFRTINFQPLNADYNSSRLCRTSPKKKSQKSNFSRKKKLKIKFSTLNLHEKIAQVVCVVLHQKKNLTNQLKLLAENICTSQLATQFTTEQTSQKSVSYPQFTAP